MNHVVLSLLNIMIRMKYLRDSDSNIIAILPRPSFYINALRLPASAHDQNLLSLQYPKTSRTKSIETHTRNLNQALGNKPSKAVSEGARDPNELWQCTNFSHYRVKVSNIIYRSYFDITSTIIVACDYYTQVSLMQRTSSNRAIRVIYTSKAV
jgi:hypothetical protein